VTDRSKQIVYLIITVTTWYYPNGDEITSNGGANTGTEALAVARNPRMAARGS